MVIVVTYSTSSSGTRMLKLVLVILFLLLLEMELSPYTKGCVVVGSNLPDACLTFTTATKGLFVDYASSTFLSDRCGSIIIIL